LFDHPYVQAFVDGAPDVCDGDRDGQEDFPEFAAYGRSEDALATGALVTAVRNAPASDPVAL
jgi:hypothetical protein